MNAFVCGLFSVRLKLIANFSFTSALFSVRVQNFKHFYTEKTDQKPDIITWNIKFHKIQ